MTPKEKAEELVFKKFGCKKQYALLLVQEILSIKIIRKYNLINKYWQEVKQEIENL